jgi:putative acetyltransferase
MSNTSRSERVYFTRPVRAQDHDAIDQVLIDAFGAGHGPDVVELVRRIRASDDYIPAMNLVIELEGHGVVGYVALSWVSFEGRGPRRLLQLTPLAVRSQFQRKGMGVALVRAALDAARRADEPLVMVQGVPAYYPALGFERASQHGIRPPWPNIADEAFMVNVLDPDMEPMEGAVVYPPTYDFLRRDEGEQG